MDSRIAELEKELAEAKTCGLCGEPPTEENHLFICCENCTDIGVSNVPKEVFELQRQLAEAKGRAERAENDFKLLRRVFDLTPEASFAKLEKAEAEGEGLKAALDEAETIANVASMYLADDHHDAEGCRFNGAKGKHIVCFACIAQDELAKINADKLREAYATTALTAALKQGGSE